jgi:tetratricopeptide (TPR) repeat protein
LAAARHTLTAPRSPLAASRFTGAAQRAGQGIAQAYGEIKSHVPQSSVPNPVRDRIRASALPVASIVAAVAMLAFVILGIAHARGGGSMVHADALPPPAADAEPTPTTGERLQPLWVQVEVAWNRQAWSDAVTALERIRKIDPRNVEARQRLAQACYYDGLRLVNANEMEQAQARLDAAIRLDAGNSDLQKARRKVAMYMDGLDAYWVRDWAQAVEKLKRVYAIDPDFRDARVMLGQAYCGYGVQLQDERRWEESKNCLEKSLELLPEHPEAQAHLAEVLDIITPPRRIELDLSEQLVTVFENHQPVKVFTVCTGRASAPTTPGRYEILDKIPNAYGSKWDIFMPWWLGIYWAGGSENGIHGLPVTRAGVTIWKERLGTPCSYGCIVMDTPDAIWLYEWAEVGTVVLIRR